MRLISLLFAIPRRLLDASILSKLSYRRIRSLHATIIPEVERFTGNVTILQRTDKYLVVDKPPAVVCHHSEWAGLKSRQELPMLQRTREAINARVNLVHRLDRPCSGCLLMTYSDSEVETQSTAKLMQAMESATKTYVALVRGEGILHGEDLKTKGWFLVDRPIKNERGTQRNASTWFRFISGQGNGGGKLPDVPRASLVLCRPKTGRWHQIRKHLNGISQPIIGDTIHGSSQTNRDWKKRWGLQPERACLHLLDMKLEPVESVCPDGIHVSSNLAPDMMNLLEDHLPSVLEDALPLLEEEGLSFKTAANPTVLPYELTTRSDTTDKII